MPTPIGLLLDPVSLAVFEMLIFRDTSRPIDKRNPEFAFSQRSS